MAIITKEIAKKYRELTAEEKKPYDDEAKTLKAAYDEKFTEYKESGKYAAYQAKKKAFKAAQKGGAEVTKGKNGKMKFAKDKNEPKRPPSGYFCFMNEERPKFLADNPGSRVGAIAKALGKKWRELGESGKVKYNEQAKELKEVYLEKLAEYKESDEYADYQARKKKFLDGQKPPPSSPSRSTRSKKTRGATKGRKRGRPAAAKRTRYVSDDDDDAMSDLHSDEPQTYSSEGDPEPEPAEEEEASAASDASD